MFSLHIDVNCVCYFILKFKFDEVKSKKWTRKNKEDEKTKKEFQKSLLSVLRTNKKNGLDVYLPIYFSMTTVKLRLVTGPHYVKSRKL